jgi:hypothetical protein
MLCFLLGPLVGLDHFTATTLGIAEGLIESLILTAVTQRYRY